MSMNGNSIYWTVKEIAETGSRNGKEAILARVGDDLLLRKVLLYTYDPFRTWGIAKAPKPKRVGIAKIDQPKHQIFRILDSLASRETTGNAAKAVVQEWMDLLDAENQAVFGWMLDKSLDAGIGAPTINKVIEGLVPDFSCMLAKPFEAKRIQAWPVAIEPKLDGFRALCMERYAEDKMGFFTRSGKPYTQFSHLERPFLSVLKEVRSRVPLDVWYQNSIVLDGEFVSGTFAKTSSELRTKDKQAKDAVLHLFDVVPYSLFTTYEQTDTIAGMYSRRREVVQLIGDIANSLGVPIKPTERYLVSSVDEAMHFYNRFRDRGLEGAMLKPLDHFYEKKRAFTWLKLKNEETEDLRIKDAFEGQGKYEGMLGGFIVDRDGVDVRVGGGFSDKQREEFWKAYLEDKAIAPGSGLEPTLLGRIVEVEFHEVTPDGSLRHPRFIRFRDDKSVATHEEKEAA